MHSFEIKLNGRGASIPGTGEWSENDHIYTFFPRDFLAGESDYTARVEARIRENGRDLMVRGAVYREELLHHFRTGPMPDRIVPDMINFTYPYIRQQNFLKSETRSNQGYIVLTAAGCPLLSVEGDVSNIDVSFTARFTSEDGEVINTRAIIEREQIIKFDVSQLQPRKLYCLQTVSYTHLDVYKRQHYNTAMVNLLSYCPFARSKLYAFQSPWRWLLFYHQRMCV